MFTIPFEEWKFISEITVSNIDVNRYKISDYGNVYDTISDRYLKHSIDDEGYHRVHLHTSAGYKSVYVHRIVLIEFEGYDTDPEKNQVDHVDCNKDNNYKGNLEWVTKEENARRAMKNNLYTQFDIKMSEDDVHLICSLLKEGKNYKYISDLLYPKYLQSTVGIVGKIYRGERWKNISKGYMPFPKLDKDDVIPSTSVFTTQIIIDICQYLEDGYTNMETSKYIKSKYSIAKSDKELADLIGCIRRGKTYRNISKNFNFSKGGDNMKSDQSTNFEESIRNYGDKIEHIDTFVEAVRRFPGKLYTARHIRNDMK